MIKVSYACLKFDQSCYRKEQNESLLAPYKDLIGHHHNITCVKFWPDGSLLLSGSVDSILILWNPYTGEKKQTFSYYPTIPKYIFNMQVLNFDINPFGTAIVCLYDTPRWRKSEDCQDTACVALWNPMKDETDLINEEQMLLNNKLESKLDLDETPIYRTCQFIGESNYLCIPNFTNSHVQLIQANLTYPPTLKHFSRLNIRKIVSDPQEVMDLPLPEKLLSYLSYNEM